MKNNHIIRKNGLFALLLATSVLSPLAPPRTVQADVVQKAAQTITTEETTQNTNDTNNTTTTIGQTADADGTTNQSTDSDSVANLTANADSAAADESASTVPKAEILIGYATADDLNLREKATIYSESLKKLNAGDSMTILSEKGKWYKVKSGKKTGYVNKLYVSTEWIAFSNTVNLNLRKEPSTSSEVLDQFNQGDAMTVLEKDGKWYKVAYGEIIGYVKKKYIDFQYNVYVDGANVNMRKKGHTESSVTKTLDTGNIVTLLNQEGSWYKVRSGKKVGYINDAYISFTEPVIETVPVNTSGSSSSDSNGSSFNNSGSSNNGGSSSSSNSSGSSSGSSSSGNSNSTGSSGSSSSSSLGQSIVNYAKQFLGNPYVYGGTSLTNGADCSGFVQSVYAHFGISLPRTSSAQRSAGYSVGSLSNAKPGDLICYYGHVGIYIGDNAIIHASNEKSGIKITYNASYRKIASIRRVIQ